MTDVVLALTCGFLAVLFALSARNPRPVIWLSLLGALAVLPRTVLTLVPPSVSWHVGITTESISVKTFSIAILVALIYVAVRGNAKIGVGLWSYLLAAVTVLGTSWYFVWPHTQAVTSGVLHIATAIAALMLGVVLARNQFYSNDAATVAIAIFLVVAIQAPVVLLQMAGVQLFPTDQATQLFEGDRPNGTFGHPGTMGKVFLLLLIILLPLTQSAAARARRWSTAAVVLMCPLVVITASRTNSVAVGATIVLWIVFSSRVALGRKITVLAGVCGLIVASIPLWTERIATGEDGSTRARLLQVGLEQIALRPFTGTGPNSYIDVVSQTEATAASGWPVHNAFLLGWAELGLVGVIILFLPYVATVFLSARAVRANGRAEALSVLASFPGLLAICVTGWGLLAELLPLWMFVTGVAIAGITTDAAAPSRPFGGARVTQYPRERA